MNRFESVLVCGYLLRTLLLSGGICVAIPTVPAAGQFGGIEIERPAWPNAKIVPRTPTKVSKAVVEGLDLSLDGLSIDTTLLELGATLTKELKLPVFVDQHGIKQAELSGDFAIKATIDAMPVRSALRKLLSPHALRAVVQDEGLVVTADFRELTRRGIAINSWVRAKDVLADATNRKLDQKHSVKFAAMSLADVVADLSKKSGIPMHVDRWALEEVGLTDQVRITNALKNVSLRLILKRIPKDLDLTHVIDGEGLRITTIETNCGNVKWRIYYLEATGFPIGDFDHVMQLIQQTIVPDTWGPLGGPSTMVPLTRGVGNRPALIVSTVNDVHEQIADLLRVMRENHIGDDPVVAL